MQARHLVPDEVVNAMVEERLTQPGRGHGFILDGYPRTQAAGGVSVKWLTRAIYARW